MWRNLNFMQIQAAGKNIILVLPMQFGEFCANRIQMFDMADNGLDTERVYENFWCPTFAKTDTNIFQSEGLHVTNNDYFKVKIEPVTPDPDEKHWRFYVDVDTIRLTMNFEFTKHDAMTWAQPHSDDLLKYTLMNKMLGVPMTGDITIDGEKYVCGKDTPCLLTQDSFKGAYAYPTNLYFGLLQ